MLFSNLGSQTIVRRDTGKIAMFGFGSCTKLSVFIYYLCIALLSIVNIDELFLQFRYEYCDEYELNSLSEAE